METYLNEQKLGAKLPSIMKLKYTNPKLAHYAEYLSNTYSEIWSKAKLESWYNNELLAYTILIFL